MKQRSHDRGITALFILLLGAAIVLGLTNSGAHAYYGNNACLGGDMPKGIKLTQWNLRSICPTGHNTTLDQLRHIVRDPWKECHVLCITETWLNETYQDKDLLIKSFHPPQRRDRVGKSGGGVAIYILDGYDFVRRGDLESDSFEAVWIEVKPTNSKPLLICAVYRPPDSPIDQWLSGLEDQIESAYTTDSHILIMGDFNVDMVAENCDKDKLCLSMSQFNMTQIVDQPTRCTAQSQTLIDHIWTTSPNTTKQCKVPHIGLSDHYPTCVTLNRKENKHQHISIKYRSFKNFDCEKFQEDLNCYPWSIMDMFDDVNDALDTFQRAFMEIVDKHAPEKEKRVKRQWQPGWMNDEILESMRNRDYHKKKNNTDLYKIWRNKCVNQIRKAKSDYYADLVKAGQGDTRKLWSYMKELNPKTPSSLPTSLQSGAADNLSIANELNVFFTDIVKKYIPQDRIEYDPKTLLDLITNTQHDQRLFEVPPLTVAETQKLLKSLPTDKATGLDGIPSKVLSCAANQIAPAICKIINLSLETGVFPDKWKHAKVTPIHKGGVLSDTNNYRPISVLCGLSKIAERHIHNHLYNHMKPHLHKAQSGFRSNYSCETALSRIIDMWTKNMDSQMLNGIILLDLRKAFDLIDHEILITKLGKYNIGLKTLHLLRSYLSERKQQVLFKQTLSDVQQVKSGIPQGSIIGPLLFISYMNDLPLTLNASSYIDMYADDATITHATKTIAELNVALTNDLSAVTAWCKNNRMAINSTKTKAMLITSAQKRRGLSDILSIALNEEPLEVVDKENLLGVKIDNDLTWKDQVDSVCRKVARNIALLRRIKTHLDIPMRRMFYMAYIQPHTDYCLTIWGMSHHIDRVQKLQNMALRVISDEPRHTRSLTLYKKFRVMKISDRIDYKMVALTYKAVNGIAPDYMTDMFKPVRDTHTRSTRAAAAGDLAVPVARLKLRRNALAHRGAKLFNQCNNDVRTAGSIECFKKRYFNEYFDNL